MYPYSRVEHAFSGEENDMQSISVRLWSLWSLKLVTSSNTAWDLAESCCNIAFLSHQEEIPAELFFSKLFVPCCCCCVIIAHRGGNCAVILRIIFSLKVRL